jgi:PAS domain S-box-containing protein
MVRSRDLRAELETKNGRDKKPSSKRAAVGPKSNETSRLRAILDSTPDGIITIDSAALITSFNRAAERMFGWSEREALGKNVAIIAAPPHAALHDDYMRRYLTTGEAKIIGKPREVEAIRKDGSKFPVLLWVTELEGTAERGFLGIVQDISVRKQAEDARESLLQAVKDTVGKLAGAAAQILAVSTEQAAGAQEQAAAVAETVASVEQISQTSEQAAERARGVADNSRRSADLGEAGRRSVDDTITGMREIKARTESIAESVLSLAEQAQAIGEIIATVTDIAEQTNLLALNAAIEAARAGEQGRGFSVVAAEVKALADQSKKATAQIRQILNQIQKATNGVVHTMEDGTKSVSRVLDVVGQAGGTIQELAVNGNDAARAAAQIAASAGQQAMGMAQINQAMKNIRHVSTQTLESTRHAERAAQDLSQLAEELRGLLANFGR